MALTIEFSRRSNNGIVFRYNTRRLTVLSILILVEQDVEDLPVADADAGVAALMVLIAVVAAEVADLAVIGDGDFIHEADAEAMAGERFLLALADGRCA